MQPRSYFASSVSPLAMALGLFALLVMTASPSLGQAATVESTTPDVLEASAEAGVTMELIMGHPDWLGRAPEDPYWSDDGSTIYFEQKRAASELRDVYRVALDGTPPTKVNAEELGHLDVDSGHWSADRRFKTYISRGDLYLKDFGKDFGKDGSSGEIRQLTRTVAAEQQPKLMPDGQHIVFQRQHNVFVRDLDSGLESQWIDLRLEDDPTPKEDESFLGRQQIRLLDIVRYRRDTEEERRQHDDALREADPSSPVAPWYLGDDIEIRSSTVSPNGQWMALVVADADLDDGKQDQMPNYVTADGYVEVLDVRPKVGTADGRTERLWILDLETHQQHEIDLSALPEISDDPLADLKERAAAEEAARLAAGSQGDGSESDGASATDADPDKAAAKDTTDEAEDTPRSVRFEEAFEWSPNGEHLLFNVHSYDNKDRWTAILSSDDLEPRTVHHLQQEGWINWYFNDYGWLPDGRHIYFLSEASGYSQLYLHDLKSGRTQRLTEGDFVVSNPVLDAAGSHIYYTANVDHPGIYEVYRVAVGDSTKAPQQLTHLGGRNTFSLSPDGEHLAILHSTTTQPSELYVQATQPEAAAMRLTHTTSDAFESLDWVAPEIVEVPSTHQDRPIYSRYYAASNDRGATSKGRPAVVFVHGAGYLQNAHQGWSGYFREFMFHTLLSQHGYAVLDMDYRASAGYGVAWREAIYRQMGTPELEDLQDGVAWLVDNQGVDPDRIGVYGGSYGGFMTMMALFKDPGLFAAGAALRPVTDWAHYNHPYTSNILNTPEVDPWAYERSSPIEFADGLADPLLICAPMQDDNVFFQDTVRLAQRLIELEKEDWEVAIFPIEPHGFRQPSSWLNEYRRIFKLFEDELQGK